MAKASSDTKMKSCHQSRTLLDPANNGQHIKPRKEFTLTPRLCLIYNVECLPPHQPTVKKIEIHRQA